ncbi:MAG: helix-hairpin-helix domain-containing protein [Actinomycetota bacterium]
MTDPLIISPRPRLRVGVGAAVVLLLAGLAVAVLVSLTGSHGSTVVETPQPITTASVAPSDAPVIYVHILGAVEHPGLFTLHDGDRVVDAIAAAGGFTAAADQSQLNLARVLADGEQLMVPATGEAAPVSTGSAVQPGGKVNINTADETALEGLPRVGPAMAQRILDWRKKNGRFSSIDDLMSVTGIGPKTFDGLKDLVTV